MNFSKRRHFPFETVLFWLQKFRRRARSKHHVISVCDVTLLDNKTKMVAELSHLTACSRSFGGGAPNKYWFLTIIRRKNSQTSSEPTVWDKRVKVIVVKAIQGRLVCYSKFRCFSAWSFCCSFKEHSWILGIRLSVRYNSSGRPTDYIIWKTGQVIQWSLLNSAWSCNARQARGLQCK